MSECCSNCFNDNQIKEFILDSSHGTPVSRCSFCGSVGVKLVKADLLFYHFDILISGLDRNENGYDASDALQRYFCIFNDKIHDKNRLLRLILADNSTLLNFKYNFSYSGLSTDDWLSFKDEIIKNNRFFPRTPIYRDVFSKSKGDDTIFDLTESLLTKYNIGDHLYRARVSETDISEAEMGKPPAHLSTTGRANPLGISYLYLANNVETCIAEVRPSKNSRIYVAKFSPSSEIKLLDLTSPREKSSFFYLKDIEVQLKEALNYISLLEVFADELSKPIVPQRSHLEYIPTQFICEFFKTICGYDGIIFNSSFGFGYNVVLFDDSNIKLESISSYNVTNIINEFSIV